MLSYDCEHATQPACEQVIGTTCNYLQALEVAQHVQRTHMHLYSGIGTDNDEPAYQVATAGDEASHQMDQGDVLHSSERQPYVSHDLNWNENSHNIAASSRENNPGVSISLAGGLNRSPEVGQADADFACHPSDPTADVAGPAEQRGRCLEDLQNSTSDRTATVQHFLAHMEVRWRKKIVMHWRYKLDSTQFVWQQELQ